MAEAPKMRLIKAGEIVLFTEGGYDDYRVVYAALALDDIDPAKKMAEYFEKYPEDKQAHSFNEERFVLELVTSGLFKAIRKVEWFVGEYGLSGTDEIREINTLIELKEEIRG